jgi:hypothetical protein
MPRDAVLINSDQPVSVALQSACGDWALPVAGRRACPEGRRKPVHGGSGRDIRVADGLPDTPDIRLNRERLGSRFG